MQITPSETYLPYCKTAFDIPTLNQSERFFLILSDDKAVNLTVVFYNEQGIRHEFVISRPDFVRVAEAIKVLDPFRNI